MYRKNVGIIVFNQNKKVLMCARADKKEFTWQFPQGGIDENETPQIAAFRELQEETSITSAKLIYITDKSFRYDFPEHLKGPYEGQEQYWALFYFNAPESEININTKQKEFKAFEWTDINTATQKIVAFKKDVYQKIVAIFKPIIEKYDA